MTEREMTVGGFFSWFRPVVINVSNVGESFSFCLFLYSIFKMVGGGLTGWTRTYSARVIIILMSRRRPKLVFNL